MEQTLLRPARIANKKGGTGVSPVCFKKRSTHLQELTGKTPVPLQPALVAQGLQKIFDEGLHKKSILLYFLAPPSHKKVVE